LHNFLRRTALAHSTFTATFDSVDMDTGNVIMSTWGKDNGLSSKLSSDL